jgi:hypothetical protein
MRQAGTWMQKIAQKPVPAGPGSLRAAYALHTCRALPQPRSAPTAVGGLSPGTAEWEAEVWGGDVEVPARGPVPEQVQIPTDEPGTIHDRDSVAPSRAWTGMVETPLTSWFPLSHCSTASRFRMMVTTARSWSMNKKRRGWWEWRGVAW